MSELDITARFSDRSRDERLQGQVVPPVGTPVGSVLTATATGSSWQAAAAGGLPTLFNTVLSADGSLDVTGIAATSAHMLLIAWLRSDLANVTEKVGVRFNNDSGANYSTQSVIGTGAAVVTQQTLGGTSAFQTNVCGDTANANEFTPLVIFIPNYASTTAAKTVYAGSGRRQQSEVWMITSTWFAAVAAINRITLIPTLGGVNWKAGSRLSGYGIG